MTDRLVLEPLIPVHAPALAALHKNPSVMHHLGGAWDRDQADGWLNEKLDHWKDNGFGHYLLRYKETNEPIGRAGVRLLNVNGQNETELGYVLEPSSWGRGLAVEAGMAVCAWTFANVVSINSIIVLMKVEHSASRRVAEKLGGSYERDILHADPFAEMSSPHALYRIPRRH